jgi:tetratricopeptide (TPR) repeat protein
MTAHVSTRTGLALVLVVYASLATRGQTPRASPVTEFLDRYVAGQFDAVANDLAGDLDFGDLLDQLKRDGPAWIDAQGPSARDRRELVAATFALEAARADQWYQWKFIWKPPLMTAGPLALPSPLGRPGFGAPAGMGGGSYQPPNILQWRAAPRFIEWACERLRRDETPRPIERWWQLAALAVAQRSEDAHFLIGDPQIGRGFPTGEIGNPKEEIKHLDHVMPRFPQEARFMLAQGIARDRYFQDDAATAYLAIAKDPDVGGEATMRLGAMQMRQGKLDAALEQLARAETLTRDPYVVYLARLFTGQIMERKRRPNDAQAAYRGAVAAWPHAQAATLALASLLFDAGRRVEAQMLAGTMLAAAPPATDPWRGFVHADDRFWPQLVGRLRTEIHK